MIKRRRREVGTRRSFPCGRQAASGTVRTACVRDGRPEGGRPARASALPPARPEGRRPDFVEILLRRWARRSMPASARRAFRSSRCRDVCRTMAITTIEGSHQSPCGARYLRQAVWHPSLEGRTGTTRQSTDVLALFQILTALISVGRGRLAHPTSQGRSPRIPSGLPYEYWSGLFGQVNAAIGEDAVVSTVGVALVPHGITSMNTMSL